MMWLCYTMKNKKRNARTHTFQCLTESIIVVTHQLLFRFAILLVRVCSQQFSLLHVCLCIIFCSLNALSSSHFSICSRSLSLSPALISLYSFFPFLCLVSLSLHLRFYSPWTMSTLFLFLSSLPRSPSHSLRYFFFQSLISLTWLFCVAHAHYFFHTLIMSCFICTVLINFWMLSLVCWMI